MASSAEKLESNVFDVWVFRGAPAKVKYLLLHTSRDKADRYFGGGRVWQIPSGFMHDSERVVPAVLRLLDLKLRLSRRALSTCPRAAAPTRE